MNMCVAVLHNIYVPSGREEQLMQLVYIGTKQMYLGPTKIGHVDTNYTTSLNKLYPSIKIIVFAFCNFIM